MGPGLKREGWEQRELHSLQKVEAGRCRTRLAGALGSVPVGHCDPGLASPSWFHGKITREQAERLLCPPETGLFLVRESTNYPGDYTLCVSCDGKVEHYRIMYHASKLSIDEEVYFENLMQLVEVSRCTHRPGCWRQPHCFWLLDLRTALQTQWHLLCARVGLWPHSTTTGRGVALSPFPRPGNEGPEPLRDLPEITQLQIGGARART